YTVTAGPIRHQNGTIVAAVAGFVDVTEKKEAEKERELFIGALGHDLRNPLTAIMMAVDSLAGRGELQAAAVKAATRIASSARRMEALIGELLDFARSQHGALPSTPSTADDAVRSSGVGGVRSKAWDPPASGARRPIQWRAASLRTRLHRVAR